MAKMKSLFVCQQCGYESPRWLGKCPSCNNWNSFVETFEGPAIKTRSTAAKLTKLSEVTTLKSERIKTKIDEFDQVLGGGIVSGQVILIAGSPGIGKSTLLMQIANNLKKTLYVSGEESVNQIAIRAKRLGIKNSELSISEGTNIDSIIDLARDIKPEALIIDSIQVMSTDDLSGMAGSVGQVRECAFRLVQFAKSTNTPTFIVGHVTKEGTMAGPSVLAHIVDTVCDFSGDENLVLRTIRVTKNRFGATDEVGVFEMKDKGLVSVTNPEKVFLTDANVNVPGNITSSIMQGTRPVMVEIEALTVSSKLAFPKRIAQGIDPRRFELLLAVLTKHCKMPLYEYDSYVSVAGGVDARGPFIDLAICLAVASSFYNIAISSKVITIGEVGLLGEIRDVVGQEKILRLAKKLGYTKVASAKEYKLLSQVIHNFFLDRKNSNK